jgi:hypothetical protein
MRQEWSEKWSGLKNKKKEATCLFCNPNAASSKLIVTVVSKQALGPSSKVKQVQSPIASTSKIEARPPTVHPECAVKIFAR